MSIRLFSDVEGFYSQRIRISIPNRVWRSLSEMRSLQQDNIIDAGLGEFADPQDLNIRIAVVPFHTATGEAEAEFVLVGQKDITDAVLSGDVNTIMFGCEVAIRNRSKEGTKGNKTPTPGKLDKVEATFKAKSEMVP